MNLLHTLFYFIVVIGVLVAVHEFGHFWIARKVGVKVLRFSIGFGNVLWKYQSTPQSTEYVVCAIPLGGYVKMVDEREGDVKPEDLPVSFNRQSVLARTAIVAAGPVFNLVLAVALFWSVLVIGETGIRPILGQPVPQSLAAQAGFSEGDEIVSVNDELTPTFMQAISTIISTALAGENEISVKVKNQDDEQSTKILHIDSDQAENSDKLFTKLGFKLFSPNLKPLIGNVLNDGMAEAAGFQSNDLVLQVNEISIKSWQEWVDIIKANPNKTLQVGVERNGVQITLFLTPNAEGKIGASVKIPEELRQSFQVHYSLSPLAAIPQAFSTTWYYSTSTLKMMGQMFVGKASLENLSGPISIAQYAGQSAEMGLVHFLKFMGLISVSLGVINLLPIPVLDGGHLFFFAIESLKGSPVSEKIQIAFQKIGMVFLMLLMSIAVFMDIGRLFQ